MFVQLFAL